MKHYKTSILIILLATLYACNENKKEQNTAQSEISDSNIDKVLPIFMKNEANTTLYKDASIDSKVITVLPEEDILLLIALSAVKDAENNVWYKCYYPKAQIEGWTRQASHWDFDEDEKHLPFLQNLTLANLQIGANPSDAKRLMGEPLLEDDETGPLETSGYIDEDDIVTTTTMEFDGMQLIYQDDRMIHAEIINPGNSFGWIVIGDKEWNKDSIMKKFKLDEDSFYESEEGDKVINMYWNIFSLSINLDADDLVETIEFHYGS